MKHVRRGNIQTDAGVLTLSSKLVFKDASPFPWIKRAFVTDILANSVGCVQLVQQTQGRISDPQERARQGRALFSWELQLASVESCA